jgi:outer membrane protein TolC
MKKYIALTLIPSCLAAHTIDIDAARTAAASERPLIKAHKKGIAAAQYAESAAVAPLLPQITGGHTSLFDKDKSVHESTHTLSIKGTQLIFAPGGPLSQQAIAQKVTERQRHLSTAAQHKVRHDVTHAFLDAWLVQEEQALVDALATYSEGHIELSSARHTARTADTHALAQDQAAHLKEHVSRDTYTERLRSARSALAAALGRKTDTDTTPLSFAPQPLPALAPSARYSDAALAQRPELKEKTAAVSQYEQEASSHYRGYLPTVSASGSVAHTFAGHDALQGTQSVASISLSWPLFDGTLRANKAWAAEAKAEQETLSRAELTNTIRSQVSTAYAAAVTARKTAEYAQLEHDRQAALFKRTELAQAAGKQSRDALNRARYDSNKAAHDLRSAFVAAYKAEETLQYRCGYHPVVAAAITTPLNESRS